MNLTTYFELIVPVRFSPEMTADPALEEAFLRRSLPQTPRLEGRPLLDQRSSPLMGCYELRQAQRRTLGLHGNESHPYTMVKENTEFRIRKIRLWLFRCGIGFVSIHMETAALGSDRVLDLVSGLCAIRSGRKIRYSQSVAPNAWKEQTVTLRDVLKKLFRLAGDDLLYPIEGQTFQKAHCLFYGVGEAEDTRSITAFLELLRSQTRSTCMKTGDEPDCCYRPFTYITWAASQRVLAAVGDLNIGRENAFFLTDAGGIRYSVFTDYLPVYLNILAAELSLQMISMKYGLFNAVAVGACPPEALSRLCGLLNTPLFEATNETHINTLFDSLLAEKVLGLPRKFRAFSDAGVTRYAKEPECCRTPAAAEPEDDALICDILRACEKIQSNVSYRGVHEDVRNRGVRDILDQKNARYTVHDQSQQGESGRGQGPGELDILFKRPDRSQWTIFEGLNILRGFGDRTKWEDHLFKLLYRYDKKGNKFLILASYTECAPESWPTAWNKFFSHISTHCPAREIQRETGMEHVCYRVVPDSCAVYAPEGYLPGNNMKIARCTYEIGSLQTNVIHIFIRLDSSSRM